MQQPKKSPLCEIVARHSSFVFENFITKAVADVDYYEWHGYCLPNIYSNAALEYTTLRNGAAIFDTSPMKKYRMRGIDAGAFFDRILTAPISHLPTMKAAYGLMCNDDGFMIDDAIIYKFAEDDYLFLNTDINHEIHFAKYNDFEQLNISEESDSLVGLAIQGPKSCAVLNNFGFTGIENLSPFELAYFELNGHRIIVGRLGFTGDLGYELWFTADASTEIEKRLDLAEKHLAITIPGYGLEVVMLCRIEAGMIVPGWDTSGAFIDNEKERTPYELGIAWNVKFNNDCNFVGKEALAKQYAEGCRYNLIGIQINGKHSIKEGQALFSHYDGNDIEIGHLPSLAWHSEKQCWLGFASVKTAFINEPECFVLCNERKISVLNQKLPFIELPHRNQTPAAL